MPESVRVYFASDVHGSERVWAKWLAVPEFYNVQVLIFAGDLTGKVVVPIIEQPNGSYTCRAFGQKYEASTKQEAEKIRETLLFSGYYPFFATPTQVEELKRDKKKVDELFEKLMVENMARWMRLVEEKVPKETAVMVMPGNDDSFAIDDVIKASERVVYPLDRVVPLCFEYEMISLDWTNPTPWQTPRECSEEELMKKLEEQGRKVTGDWSKVVCNFHCPPFGTKLDLAPELDKNLKVKADASGPRFEHVGSRSILDFLKKYQPLLGVHGHIHESAGFENIRRTLCFNSGSEYGEGILKGAVFEFQADGLAKWWPTSG
jgi:Icc-related predicted phosphoesterase